jgi:hypothetical protein
MKRIALSAFAAIVVMGSSFAAAQYSSSSYERPAATTSAPVYYPMAFPSGYRNHASTSEQGVLSGLGDLYRGVGEYEVASSFAAYNWQLARSAALQNNVAERAARAQIYKHSALAQQFKHIENMKKNQRVAEFNTKLARPTLAASQLDRTTGRVVWPAILYEARFEKARLDAEEGLRQKFDRRQVSTSSSDQSLSISINELQSQLDKDKGEMRPSDYYVARAFLGRMKNELTENGQNIAASF